MKSTVIIVDDDDFFRETLKAILEPHHAIIEFENGNDFLANIGEIAPDLVLLDVDMPIMNGYEACKVIKNNSLTRDTPIIFITSHSEAQAEVRAFELGAQDFITKPFVAEVVLARVNTHIQKNNYLKTLIRVIDEEICKKEMDASYIKKVVFETKSELLKDISHHWRNPMSAINMLVYNLLDKFDEESDIEHYHRIVKSLKTLTESVMKLSNTIGEYRSLFNREKNEFAEFNIKQEILKSLDFFQSSTSDTSIAVNITHKTEPVFYGSGIDFYKIIDQIIKNSIEAIEETTPKNPSIDFCIYEENGFICIDIKDNGGGVKEVVKDTLFEPYTSTKGPQSGRGMGLYISKILACKSFKGDIVWQNFNGGALFTVTLRNLIE